MLNWLENSIKQIIHNKFPNLRDYAYYSRIGKVKKCYKYGEKKIYGKIYKI